jgi:hypothetical protein
VSKNNLLEDTLKNIDACNLHKEIKIFFDNENVNDAGGLLREFICLLNKELFSAEKGLFVKANTEEFCYKINPSLEISEQSLNLMKLVGKIFGKAVFERIPINAYLDITLLKHILNKTIEL